MSGWLNFVNLVMSADNELLLRSRAKVSLGLLIHTTGLNDAGFAEVRGARV